MEFGAHLPLMDFGGHPYTLDHLTAYTKTAAQLGFGALSANDHMVFSVPWLDGPIALAAVMGHSGDMTLATTVFDVANAEPFGAVWLPIGSERRVRLLDLPVSAPSNLRR